MFGQRRMKRQLLSLKFLQTTLLVSLLATGECFSAQPAAEVPKAYVPLYTELERILDDQTAAIGVGRAPAVSRKPLLSVDLLAANSNRGPALLRPETMDVVRLSLDRFQPLGIRCVKFAVHYPLLRPDFPAASEYLAFYREVVKEAHARNIKVMPHVTVMFADTPFSPFKGLYKSLDLNRFKQEYRDMVHLVVKELHPDFLALLTEPDTHARLTGLAELNQPETFADVVQFALKGLSRDKTLIGAGSGSWSPPAFAEALASRTDVDFIAIHVYPITGHALSNVQQMAQIAHAHGKQAIIDEAWLYKVLKPGGGENIAATASVFRLDSYSFWQPLDKKFITCVLRLAERENITVVSFFWSNLLFSYLDYTPELERVSYADLTSRLNQAAYKNMRAGKYSDVGDFLRQQSTGVSSAWAPIGDDRHTTANGAIWIHQLASVVK